MATKILLNGVTIMDMEMNRFLRAVRHAAITTSMLVGGLTGVFLPLFLIIYYLPPKETVVGVFAMLGWFVVVAFGSFVAAYYHDNRY